jgi:hypothetical protein
MLSDDDTGNAALVQGDAGRSFGWALRRTLLIWQAGLLVEAALRLAALAIALLLAVMAADFLWMFNEDALTGVDIAAGCVLGVAALAEVCRVATRTVRAAASRVDSLLGDRRQPVLTALELCEWRKRGRADAGGLERYLVDAAGRDGVVALGRVPWSAVMPVAALRRCAVAMLVAAVVFAALVLPDASPARVVLRRVMAPHADIPPYSRYRFAVEPASPEVVYGGTIELKVVVSGAPVKGQVEMTTRFGGRAHRSACFQEGGQRYAQRIEKVVNPVEFCFTVGRARSTWRRVDLLLEPRISGAEVEIAPPSYSGLPARRFAAGAEDIRSLKGAAVSMRVTSNRPLSDGRVVIRAEGERIEEADVVVGKPDGPNAVVFAWRLTEAARLSVQVRDVRGTTNSAPFALQQSVVPDEVPRVSIGEPAAFSLVTPGVVVPLSGSAEDDLGVARVELVRSVVGYRDRVRRLVEGTQEKRVQFGLRMDLSKLGVEPGDVIEFYAEARDSNPEMTGIGVSDVRRMEVISEADYREMLRVRTTAEAFVARFRVIAAAYRTLQEAYSAALAEVEGGKAGAERQRAILDGLKEKTRAMASRLEALGKDFAVYDMEQEFHAASAELAQSLGYNLQMLERATPGDPALPELLGRMVRNVGEAGGRIGRIAGRADEVAAVARLMEAAGEFQRLLRKQGNLVRRLSRFAGQSRTADTPLLRMLGNDETPIRKGFSGLVETIRTNAKGVPAYAAKLAADARAVADGVEGCGALALMEEAESAAINQDGDTTHRKAALALERLADLLKKMAGQPGGGTPGQGEGEGEGEGEGNCNSFAAMVRGRGGPGFRAPDDLRQTLGQMLSALRRRSGSGNASGGGSGGGEGGEGAGMDGGDVNDGFWMGGSSLFNVPVIGPERSAFGGSDTGGGGSGNEGSGATSGAASAVSGTESTAPAVRGDVKADARALDRVPDKYREAVKRYFSRETGVKP